MRLRWFIAAYAALMLGVFPAYAKDKPEWRSWPMGERVGVNVGAFFANLETTVRIDATNGAFGTAISFERDLGLDDTKTTLAAGAHWRFLKRSRLDFTYFELDRSGASSTSVNIRVGDNVFQANLPLQAFLDIQAFSVGYSYSILFDEKKELALGLALSFQELTVGIQGTVAGQPLEVSTTEDVLAPLPTFTGRFSYAFTPKWIFKFAVGYFFIETDFGNTRLDGEILGVNTSIDWQVFKHFNVGLGYNFFDVDASTEKERRTTDINYTYDGPILFMGTRF